MRVSPSNQFDFRDADLVKNVVSPFSSVDLRDARLLKEKNISSCAHHRPACAVHELDVLPYDTTCHDKQTV